MTDMKIAIRLGRKSRVNSSLEPSSAIMFVYDFPNKIRFGYRLFRHK